MKLVNEQFRRHASPEAIRAELKATEDLVRDAERLAEELRTLLSERERQIELGEWPR